MTSRMLGLTGRDGAGWSLGGSLGEVRKLKRRVERHREQQEFERLAAAWRSRPDVRVDGADDPSDCQHGCNGDCEEHGSDWCNWLCHPPSPTALVEQWAERVGHTNPDGEPDEELVRAHLEEIARQVAESLARLDGSPEASLSLITGFSREEIEDLGGL